MCIYMYMYMYVWCVFPKDGGLWRTDEVVLGGPLPLTWDLWWTAPRRTPTLGRGMLSVGEEGGEHLEVVCVGGGGGGGCHQ